VGSQPRRGTAGGDDVSGNGPISAVGGPPGLVPCAPRLCRGRPAQGRRTRAVAAETFNRTTATTPAASVSRRPGVVAGAPTLLSRALQVSVPGEPDGKADITLAATRRPVSVGSHTSGVPETSCAHVNRPWARSRPSPGPHGSTASARRVSRSIFPRIPMCCRRKPTFHRSGGARDLLRNFAGNERVEKSC